MAALLFPLPLHRQQHRGIFHPSCPAKARLDFVNRGFASQLASGVAVPSVAVPWLSFGGCLLLGHPPNPSRRGRTREFTASGAGRERLTAAGAVTAYPHPRLSRYVRFSPEIRHFAGIEQRRLHALYLPVPC